jgi:hypothetical protein
VLLTVAATKIWKPSYCPELHVVEHQFVPFVAGGTVGGGVTGEATGGATGGATGAGVASPPQLQPSPTQIGQTAQLHSLLQMGQALDEVQSLVQMGGGSQSQLLAHSGHTWPAQSQSL